MGRGGHRGGLAQAHCTPPAGSAPPRPTRLQASSSPMQSVDRPPCRAQLPLAASRLRQGRQGRRVRHAGSDSALAGSALCSSKRLLDKLLLFRAPMVSVFVRYSTVRGSLKVPVCSKAGRRYQYLRARGRGTRQGAWHRAPLRAPLSAAAWCMPGRSRSRWRGPRQARGGAHVLVSGATGLGMSTLPASLTLIRVPSTCGTASQGQAGAG